MLQKVLIANRGEIAVRIIRACCDLGIATVAVYSEADRDALHVRLAHEAVCIGPAPTAQSYLHIPNIVSAALITSADAIHPGAGFLAENHYFAEICEKYRLVFIGPHPAVIERLSDKVAARRAMREVGLPVLPGSEGFAPDLAAAADTAAEIGYPVMIKAVGGGGGRGIRPVASEAELSRLYPIAQAEAEASFGSDRLYVEKHLVDARHVEVQVLGDRRGNVIHVGDRDCTLQRRHQKIVEEAPSPQLSPALQQRLREAAVIGAEAVGYTNAGTFEFLVDRAGSYYFLEVNTRLQVEHTVTEMISGLDLVREQLLIAGGEQPERRQEDIVLSGHALECRINVEDAEHGFAPSAGQVTVYLPPGGPQVRVDSHLYTGYHVPPHYDSLVAKVVTWGHDRAEAVAVMRRALDELTIEGVATTVAFQRRIIGDPLFERGEISTTSVDEYFLAQPAGAY
jgi:acetyl-CoA carboxylase biotin carboxylase subunit